ncbi:MAG: dTDP-4-dehydrorhamnose 3,5-epimerase [Candidatus Sedimenticola sp. (ex Thyasira tokunagai)]
MEFIETKLPGVMIIEPKVFGDERGFFLETFRTGAYSKAGITEPFVQANHSRSTRGVLRGLHYQLVQPQGKLVRVARGSVYDVAVDVRRGSPHFGDWCGAALDDTDMRMMYIPPGFAHGFVVLSEVADFIYQCTDYYHPESEQGIAWNDPAIGIEWPLQDVSLSEKDLRYPVLSEQSEANLPRYPGM